LLILALLFFAIKYNYFLQSKIRRCRMASRDVWFR
jgi:hypothetical protein